MDRGVVAELPGLPGPVRRLVLLGTERGGGYRSGLSPAEGKELRSHRGEVVRSILRAYAPGVACDRRPEGTLPAHPGPQWGTAVAYRGRDRRAAGSGVSGTPGIGEA